jgi:hypothetical protein
MSTQLVGTPSEWVNLIDTLVPNILDLLVATWQQMPPLATNTREDPTTEAFCRLLRQNRNSGNLPFNIHIQMIELDPTAGQDQGRMDIAFQPLVPREDIYFCLECKRLNVASGGGVRAYASEYVNHGMVRFVRGQYSAMVRHGGMLGYVLDGNITRAIQNVGDAIQTHHATLGMQSPGEMLPSTIRPQQPLIRETRHTRSLNPSSFQIHHLFVAPKPTGPKPLSRKRAKSTAAKS